MTKPLFTMVYVIINQGLLRFTRVKLPYFFIRVTCESLLYCHAIIIIVLVKLFSLMLKFQYVPNALELEL